MEKTKVDFAPPQPIWKCGGCGKELFAWRSDYQEGVRSHEDLPKNLPGLRQYQNIIQPPDHNK